MTTQQKFEEDHFIKGIYIPAELDDTKPITISVGGFNFNYSKKTLSDGIGVSTPFSKGGKGGGLYAKLIDNRLYVSTYIRDIKNGELIGDMDLNKWKLKSDKIYEAPRNDSIMEVIDANGFVVFGMFYTPKTNSVTIRGYSIVNNVISVVDNNGTMTLV